MTYKFVIPGTDSGANAKFEQFKTGFAANAVALGYGGSDISDVNDAWAAFNTKLATAETAKAEAQNAVFQKNKQKPITSSTIRDYAEQVKLNPIATPEMLASMGIVPASTPSGTVYTPNGVQANANANGTCRVKWNPNGNPGGTIYVIEAMFSGGSWFWLANASGKSITDNSASPGVTKSYRIRAQRGSTVSAPSDAATIYPTEDSFSLEEAA